MKIPYNKILIFLFTTIMCSCTDVFEENIEDEKINILAPADNNESDIYNQIFWWDALDGALTYNVQIVSPSFADIEKIVLDTNVANNKFSFTLDPGKYQWRIRGENGSSITSYVTRSFEIDTSTLANQTISIYSPLMTGSASSYWNSKKVTFVWGKLFGAENYIFQVDSINGNFTGSLKADRSLTELSTTVDFPYDGIFKWRVKAQSLPDESPYSTSQSFVVDTKPPGKISIVSPATNNSIDRSLSFTWNASASSDVNKYALYVYRVRQEVSIADTIRLDGFPLFIQGRATTSYPIGNIGQANDRIVWQVKAYDLAGNEGAFSEYGYFTLGN